METPQGQLQLAFAHHLAGRRAEAEGICRRILEHTPRHAGALQLLGLMAQQQGRLEVALRLMRMVVAADPGVADYHNSLGTVLADLMRFDEALAEFEQAMKLRPEYAEAQRNRGIALARAGRLAEAVAPLQEAARLRPEDAAVWEDLVSLHHQLGDLPAMIECRRRIMALRPDDPGALGELLVTLFYSPDYSPEQILEEHREWARRFERTSAGKDPHPNPLPEYRAREQERYSPDSWATNCDVPVGKNLARPLRIGYVSGDFREHPAARFVLPVLRAHDRGRVRVVCYSDVGRPLASGGFTKPDAQTDRFRAAADLWRDSSGWSDEQLAGAVRADGIDVLVDLAGHLDSRRLTAFALRPAPVQVSYFGYPGSTGTSCIGYRITDEWQGPISLVASGQWSVASEDDGLRSGQWPVASEDGGRPGESDRFHTEKLIRILGGCWCYDAGDDVPAAVSELPALSRGHVTFAMFNRLIKVTAAMVRLWQQVLDRVPGSKLAVLASPGEGGVQAAADLLIRHGIDAGRLVALPRVTRPQYLKLYDQVDIALDTYPYAGMTTTCDALWMGVPTVTLAGASSVSRTGQSLLNAAGLPQLVAQNCEQYVGIAAILAADLSSLSKLRATLRQQLAASPLCDAGRVACGVETAYYGGSRG